MTGQHAFALAEQGSPPAGASMTAGEEVASAERVRNHLAVVIAAWGGPDIALAHHRGAAVIGDPTTEAAVLAMVVPAHGTIRRMLALMTFGFTPTRIAAELQVPRDHLRTVGGRRLWEADPGTDTVTPDLYRAMAALFTRLELTTGGGGSKRAHGIGRSLGGVMPFAWDEEAIDDPAGAPCDCVRTRESSGADRRAHWRELIRAEFRPGQDSAATFGRRMGTSARTIERGLREIRAEDAAAAQVPAVQSAA
ncbi:hypothetical protein [Nocardia sp. IFM 10818]